VNSPESKKEPFPYVKREKTVSIPCLFVPEVIRKANDELRIVSDSRIHPRRYNSVTMRARNLFFCLWLGTWLAHAATVPDNSACLPLANDQPVDLSTDFGRYQAKVYYAIMSRWYCKLNDWKGRPPEGSVKLQFTISSTGTVQIQVLDDGGPALKPVLEAATHCITESCPFAPFTDSMHKGAGDNFREFLTFSSNFNKGRTPPTDMSTELGKYKAMVYRAVGTRWYHKARLMPLALPLGTCTVNYTIHADGSVITKIVGVDDPDKALLRDICVNSIRESAPFTPFSDALRKEVGNSYTDDFAFTVTIDNSPRPASPAPANHPPAPKLPPGVD
jgi:hypothetical protein